MNQVGKITMKSLLGEVGKNMSVEEHKSFSHKTRILLDHVFGEVTPKKKKRFNKATPVKINGKVYGSMSVAARTLKISFYKINNRVRSKDSKWINWTLLNKPIH